MSAATSKPAVDVDTIREDLVKAATELAALPYKSVGTQWELDRKRQQIAAWDAHVTALQERVADAARVALELVDAKVELANLRGIVARPRR
jgi:predicted  nucleic acid-binding Zn-ribbon protein